MEAIDINCGWEKIRVRIPKENLAWNLGPKQAVSNADSVKNALLHPTGQKKISILGKGKQDAIVVIDDNTRNTPIAVILPEVIRELKVAGIAPEKIKILVALGTHRKMTPEELVEKCGKDVVETHEIIQHDYLDEDNLIFCGKTKSGMPITINRHYMEASLKIAIGKIIPHVDVVWSGGAKIILPGICGRETIETFHVCSTKNREELKGQVGNVVRTEIEAVAAQVGLDFLINVIVDEAQGIVEAVAGDFVEAHRKGVQMASDMFCVNRKDVEQCDLVIVSSFPADEDFWQAAKAVTAVSPLVKQNGSIALISACYNGYCPDHPVCLDLQDKSIDEINSMMKSKQITDKVGATVCVDIKKIQQMKTILYCGKGLDDLTLKQANVGKIGNLECYINNYIDQLPACRIGVVRNGTEFLVLDSGR